MKYPYLNLIKNTLLGLLLLLPTLGFSDSFTAVVSGDWSSSLTWGGTVPPDTITGEDNVIISAGVTVNMDVDVMLDNQLATINLIGSLESPDNTLNVSSGTVLGTGNLEVAELIIGAQGTVATTGMISSDILESASTLVVLSASTQIASELVLSGGVFQIGNTGSLMLDSDATIEIAGGALQANGELIASGMYNLRYTGSSTNTGDETTAGVIANLTVDLENEADTLTLDGDLTVNDTLSLETGILSMTDFDLTLNGMAQAEGSSSISGSANSNLILNGVDSMGTIIFADGGEMVDTLIVNIGGNGSVSLESSLLVNSHLKLESGQLIINDNDLRISVDGNIEGASINSFINTSGEGHLVMTIESGGGAQLFPVGSDFGPFQCLLTQNIVTTDTTSIKVRVMPGVFSEGESGVDLTVTESLVDHTWFVSKADTDDEVNLDFELFWNADAEVNGFDNDNCFISHYVDDNWDVSVSASAESHTNGQFSITRENIVSLSPFRIKDKTTTSNTEKAVTDIVIFPNPAIDILTLELPSGHDYQEAEILDLNGNVVQKVRLSETNYSRIQIGELPPAHYLLRIDQRIERPFVKK
ncbi:MAG: T9SS type A sorting domain-containing protein [Saprospiraceae bacterium]|nr:T9SS type A sorting domain-containing protein [Saprospiraceae bacterium]